MLHVRSLGVVVGVPAPDADVLDRWRRQWGRALATGPAQAIVDDRELAGLSGDRLDYRVTSLVTMAALEHTKGERINLHAAGLADEQGRVLALIGPSGTGKTTAARRLARDLDYVSDETVSIGVGLDVAVHPKPLSVIVDDPGAKQQRSADDEGLRATPHLAQLHRLVLLRRGAGPEPGLRPVESFEAIVAMVPESSSLAITPDCLWRLHEIVTACGGAWRLDYTEIDDHAGELIALLAAPPRAVPPVRHLPGEAGHAEIPGRYARCAWLDALDDGAEALVMVGSQVFRLAGLGRVLWLAAAAPATRSELVAAAEHALGEHPQAAELVDAALVPLLEHGLLAGEPVSPPA